MWNKFFTSNGASLKLYEIDLDKDTHRVCAKKFLTMYPPGTIVEDVYLGSQADKDFMRSVVQQSGGNYDIVVDDGGHRGDHIRPSFEVLWEHVNEGGIYVIEDLGMMPSKFGEGSFVRDIDGWIDQLTGMNYGFADKKNSEWTVWPSEIPKDMVEINCQLQICALKKRLKK